MAQELRVWYISYIKSLFLKQDTCKMTVPSEANFYCALPYWLSMGSPHME